VALGLSAPLTRPASADPDEDGHLQAQPFVFVGSASPPRCTGGGGNIVTSFWLGGMGLPDDGTTPNPSPKKNDRQEGLLLNKNGPTPTCASAGATIKGLKKAATITELGFDHRLGDHCGAGAPRFNVTTTAGPTLFFGCAGGTPAPAPQDPTQWERIRFTLPAGTQARSVEIIFDEGTDTVSPSDPNGVGLAVLDNIDVNGQLITNGPGPGSNP